MFQAGNFMTSLENKTDKKELFKIIFLIVNIICKEEGRIGVERFQGSA